MLSLEVDMKIEGEAKLLRIFIGESDKLNSVSLYEKIVVEAKKFGLAGATVFKGVMGFGGNSTTIHSSKLLTISADLPVIIEIVDEVSKIESFIPLVDKLFEESNCGGLITLEKAEIIKYVKSKKG
jgi:PII-like signaling protein